MMVMPANWSKNIVHYWAGRFPRYLGHLYSPGAQRGPFPWLPYALDNGRFSAWEKNTVWDEARYMALLAWAQLSGQNPVWAVVPDVVTDREATLKEWERWLPILKPYGWPLAFAVQDGMMPDDVPDEAAIVFVGGSFEWKWRTAWQWCEAFPRVHVGRVNTYSKLRHCERLGAESCDGTGWSRGDKRQLDGLYKWLCEQTGERVRQKQESLWQAA